MKILMREALSPKELDIKKADIAFIGRVVDDRCEAAVSFVEGISDQVIEMHYRSGEFELSIGSDVLAIDDAFDYMDKFSDNDVIIDATTLGFAEIFILFRGLYESGKNNVQVMYVEPADYTNTRRTKVLHKRDFELSDEFPGYSAIPGATFMMTDRNQQKCVFFLGFEERRLERAFEDYPMLSPSKCPLVFGVPAYTPGWEMNSFANNIRVMRDKSLRGGLLYCGAENPLGAYNVLEEVYKGRAANERLFVAPIGTKPNAIGAAAFVAINEDVGILYDHPIRKLGRSNSIGRWHKYDIVFK